MKVGFEWFECSPFHETIPLRPRIWTSMRITGVENVVITNVTWGLLCDRLFIRGSTVTPDCCSYRTRLTISEEHRQSKLRR